MNQIKHILIRYLYIIGFAVCLISPVHSQIQNIEYFFDHDPGFGNATALNFTPSNEVSGQYALDVSTISTGFHYLGIRAKDASGWGQTRVKSVYNLKSSANSVITNVEYFIGTDPGKGNANALSITPATTIQGIFALDLSETPTGFNYIGFRCKTENGDWGQTKVTSIYNIKSNSNLKINNVEYFIDNDPGIGNANELTITPATSIQGAFELDFSEIETGFHYIGFRCKTENGDWGQTKINSFYNIKSAANSKITNVEYFIDEDPGNGSASVLSITPDTVVQGAFELDLSEISTGFHNIGFRCKTENGDWGQTKINSFYNIKSAANSKITNVEYFIDEDPGIGSASVLSITPDTVVNGAFELGLSEISTGFHNIGFRCKTENGDWGQTRISSFYNLKSSASSVITNAEYFIDNDPGIENAIAITLTPGLTIETSLNIDASTLASGYHTFGVRCKTEDGDWGLTFMQIFYKDDVSTELFEVQSTDEMISVIYPNPTTSNIHIKILNVTGEALVDIVNLDGQKLIQKKFVPTNNQISETIDLSKLPKGTYLVVTKNNEVIKSKKIVVN